MPADILAAERVSAQPIGGPARTAPLHSVLKELTAAKRITSDLAYSASSQLDGEGMHSLSMIEGLIAGAITKLEAAGVAS